MSRITFDLVSLVLLTCIDSVLTSSASDFVVTRHIEFPQTSLHAISGADTTYLLPANALEHGIREGCMVCGWVNVRSLMYIEYLPGLLDQLLPALPGHWVTWTPYIAF